MGRTAVVAGGLDGEKGRGFTSKSHAASASANKVKNAKKDAQWVRICPHWQRN
jgi:hypothetical protein